MLLEVCTHPWRFAVPPFRIAGSLYYVGNSYVSSYLIDTGAGLILLDTAFPQTVYLLLESIRRLGFDPDDIVYILHCHAHYDHCGGTRALVELTGAETFLGQADIEILQERPDLTWAPQYGVEWNESFTVDHALLGGEAISLGNTSIECLHIPGHTPGCMAYFFNVSEGGREYAVGINGGPGLNTLTHSYMQQYGIPSTWRADYLSSVARMRRRKVDIMLGAHPGQNDTLGKRLRMAEPANPFVDPSAWPNWLDTLESEARRQFE